MKKKKSIKKKYFTHNINNHHQNDTYPILINLNSACVMNDLVTVREILKNTNFKTYNNLEFCMNNAIWHACKGGSLDVVKYLLTSPNLNCHSNIYSYESRSFRDAIMSGSNHIIEYLIFDYDIQKNSEIDEYLKINPELNELFNLRKTLKNKVKIKDELDIELSNNKKINSKIKL